MNITPYSTRHFVTLAGCGPLRFSIWKQLARQDSASVIRQPEAVFFERGPPHENLTDNDIAFRSKEFQAFAHEWWIHLRFRCTYAPAGNGIAERCHRTVKRIAARMRCSIQEAVYWYNITPRDDVSPSTAPANRIYRYEVGVKEASHATASLGPKHSSYQVGDRVWVKAPQNRCTTKFSKGEVTKIIRPQSILVDGIPRHCVITPEVDSDCTTSSERRAESLLQDDGEDSEPEKAPSEETEAGPRLPACTKKYQTKAPAARLQSLWSWDQWGVWGEKSRTRHLKTYTNMSGVETEIRDRETGDWEDQTHILPTVNHVWRHSYLHAGAHVNYYIVRLTRMWRFGMMIQILPECTRDRRLEQVEVTQGEWRTGTRDC